MSASDGVGAFGVCTACVVPASLASHEGAFDFVQTSSAVVCVRAVKVAVACSHCHGGAVDATSGMCFLCGKVQPLE